MKREKLSVAVVVLNWNGAQVLRRFLPSVVQHSAGAEIVVADNGSTDNSVSVLMHEFPSVRRILLEQNLGFAGGYQAALQRVKADLYVLLNSDVEVGPGWLVPLVDYIESHPHVGACQPKLMSLAERNKFEYAGACGGFIDRWGYPYCRGRVFETVETDHGQYDEPAQLLWATGAALVVRSYAYWQVGGLDARFFAHQEELDLCWRLRSAGFGVACVPASRVWHQGAATLSKENPRKTFLNFRNNLLLLYKNLPGKRLYPVLFVRFWLDALASLQFLLSGKWRDALAVWRARLAFWKIRPQFAPNRKQNLACSMAQPQVALSRRSILIDYYLLGRKTFSAIHKK